MNDETLLYVDVDGVLNPYICGSKKSCKDHQALHGWERYPIDTEKGQFFPLLLNKNHGAKLLGVAERTGATLTWGTMWRDDANRIISPKVGLPTNLPYVNFAGLWPQGMSVGLYKAMGIANHANGRPFVWLDDEPDAGYWLGRMGLVQPYKFIRIDPKRGLSSAYLWPTEQWLARHRPHQTAAQEDELDTTIPEPLAA
jgi:Swiss Army Knife RNA repair-like protein